MENAVIGVFDDFQHAQDAADALVGAGFREWAVQISPKEETHAARETALDDQARYSSSQNWSIGNFFRTLFGLDADHEHAHVYAEAMRRGSFLLTVEAEGEGPVQQAREIMGQFHPVDMHERAAHWRSQGWSRYDPASQAYTDEQVQRERSAYETMSGGGQRGNANVQSFRRPGEGASPGGGSEFSGGTDVTGTARQSDAERHHSYQASAAIGGGAGFGAAGGAAAGGVAGSAASAASEVRPTGSGGTLGSLGAGNADLHESSGGPGGMSAGSMAGESMGGGEIRDPLMGRTPGVESAGMAGDATDRIREEVMGGESLGRDTMSGNQPGSVREAMGAGSGSGDPASTGIAGGANTASQSQRVYDQGLGRQTSAPRHTEETSGIMGNAAMRDSTAPDIYHMEHDADYRTHWQKAYHMEGRYEDFEPAYRFGADLHRNEAMKDYHQWNDIEPEARRHWEAGSPHGTWDKARDAVRHAWERMKHQP